MIFTNTNLKELTNNNMEKVRYESKTSGSPSYLDGWLNEQKNEFEIVGYSVDGHGEIWVTIKIYINKTRV